MPSPVPKKLRILCFGNSLTAGYCAWGTEHFPYADHLPTPLQQLYPETSIHIDVAALSGDRVVGGLYLRRLESRLSKANASQNPYDWVIIMGGTNDLGWGCVPDRLYEGLSMCSILCKCDTGSIDRLHDRDMLAKGPGHRCLRTRLECNRSRPP